MKIILIAITLLSITSCALLGTDYDRSVQKQRDNEYTKKVVKEAGGYQPEGYKGCLDGEKLVKFGDGYICKDQSWSQEEIGTLILASLMYGFIILGVILSL